MSNIAGILLAQLVDEQPTPVVREVAMNDEGQRIDGLADENCRCD
jgi:hypothetical protein